MILDHAILPALADLAPHGISGGRDVQRLMLAIGYQESGFEHRRQIVQGQPIGPAMGYWQFEYGGGCAGVFRHKATARIITEACERHHVEPVASALWDAIRYHDVLAATAARLLIYTLPQPLPNAKNNAWNQYLAAWRPGRPHPERWDAAWLYAAKALS